MKCSLKQVSAVDAISGPTLLGYVKTALSSGQTTADIAHKISYGDMLLGFKAGSLGEIAALALLLGFMDLLYRKVITWHIPVSVIGSMAVFSGILWGIDPLHYMNPLFQVLTGGALLGAIFMATDYVTSPMTPRGMAVYGIGIWGYHHPDPRMGRLSGRYVVRDPDYECRSGSVD